MTLLSKTAIVFAPENIKHLIELRKIAREEKNRKEADRLREELDRAGYWIEDTPEGMKYGTYAQGV